MIVKRYTSSDTEAWNSFVRASKNGTFLFCRQYMDYHSDRFADHSLMFYDDKNRLIALMPGNVNGSVYYSHQGLTYGGLILSSGVGVSSVLSVFDEAAVYLRGLGIKQWFYKQIPTIYHLLPSEEDDYALFRHGAQLDVCNISCAVELGSSIRPKVDSSRRNNANKCKRSGVIVTDSESPDLMWPIMERNLSERYGARPVHSLDEMKLLMRSNPDNIKCHLLYDVNGVCLGGCIIYLSRQVAHLQYGHVSPEGRTLKALDFLYTSLIERYGNIPGVRYFDFGTSNEDAGRYLNETLVAQKEGFGGRGVAYKTFRIDL